MTLAQQLAERKARSRASRPAAALEVMDRATATLASSGAVERALGVGASAPDFTLTNATGVAVRLQGLLPRGPVVLSFYRGGWCPYCNLELRALQQALPDIAGAGATLVAVSPQTPDASLSTKEKAELTYEVLSDPGNTVARRYGLVFTVPEDLREVYDGFGINLVEANGTTEFELPIPATYVIDRDGTVAWAFTDADYTLRAEPADVVAAVQRLAVRA